jgi:hypothetical protein
MTITKGDKVLIIPVGSKVGSATYYIIKPGGVEKGSKSLLIPTGSALTSATMTLFTTSTISKGDKVIVYPVGNPLTGATWYIIKDFIGGCTWNATYMIYTSPYRRNRFLEPTGAWGTTKWTFENWVSPPVTGARWGYGPNTTSFFLSIVDLFWVSFPMKGCYTKVSFEWAGTTMSGGIGSHEYHFEIRHSPTIYLNTSGWDRWPYQRPGGLMSFSAPSRGAVRATMMVAAGGETFYWTPLSVNIPPAYQSATTITFVWAFATSNNSTGDKYYVRNIVLE